MVPIVCLEHPINHVILVQLLSNLDSFPHSDQKHVAGQHAVTWQNYQVNFAYYCRYRYLLKVNLLFYREQVIQKSQYRELMFRKRKKYRKKISRIFILLPFIYFASLLRYLRSWKDPDPDKYTIIVDLESGSDLVSNGSYRSVSGIMLEYTSTRVLICT